MHDDTFKWTTIAILSYAVGYFIGKESAEEKQKQEQETIKEINGKEVEANV